MKGKSPVLELASKLEKAGIASSRVNAEVMLSDVLGYRIIDLYMNEIVLSPEHIESLKKMVSRRINGEPLQHITGKVNFYGNDFVVREGVFIPRPETEILVDVVIELASGDRQLNIFDLCTGSGNVAVSLTKALTRCKIISSDISVKALKAAAENADLNSVSKRIEFIKADLFNIPEKYRGTFDIIVSNPPYIRSGEIKGLSEEVRRDPIEALDGGSDGMSFYRRIIEASPNFLIDGGFLVLELADDLSKDVKRFIESTGNFSNIKTFKDLNYIERVIAAQKPK
jgi:release factor glutamine methyltransferase